MSSHAEPLVAANNLLAEQLARFSFKYVGNGYEVRAANAKIMPSLVKGDIS
jgi:hypothetical protein